MPAFHVWPFTSFFLFFVVIFVIVQRSIQRNIYHRIKAYIYLLRTITSLNTEEIILVPAHENNFTKSFEGELECAEQLPALPRTM